VEAYPVLQMVRLTPVQPHLVQLQHTAVTMATLSLVVQCATAWLIQHGRALSLLAVVSMVDSIQKSTVLPNPFFPVAVDCGGLPSPANGQVDTGTTTFGSTAAYSCNNGYTLSGSAMRNCLADATWSGTKPTCSRKYGGFHSSRSCVV